MDKGFKQMEVTDYGYCWWAWRELKVGLGLSSSLKQQFEKVSTEEENQNCQEGLRNHLGCCLTKRFMN